MNSKTLVKNFHLSKEALERVSQCVKNAESKTSGEIVVAVAAESSDYSFWELFAAVIISISQPVTAAGRRTVTVYTPGVLPEVADTLSDTFVSSPGLKSTQASPKDTGGVLASPETTT